MMRPFDDLFERPAPPIEPVNPFAQFARLPPELRLKIWAFTRFIQPPRVIEIRRTDPHPLILCSLRFMRGPSGHPEQTSDYHSDTPSSWLLPPAYHVCRESRMEMQRWFTWMDWGCFFDYGRDTIYLVDGCALGSGVLQLAGFFLGGRNRKEPPNIDLTRLRFLATMDQGVHMLQMVETRFPDSHILQTLRDNLREFTCVLTADDTVRYESIRRWASDTNRQFVDCTASEARGSIYKWNISSATSLFANIDSHESPKQKRILTTSTNHPLILQKHLRSIPPQACNTNLNAEIFSRGKLADDDRLRTGYSSGTKQSEYGVKSKEEQNKQRMRDRELLAWSESVAHVRN